MFNPMIFNDEIFKDIKIDGIYDIYSISNYGNVINKNTGRFMSLELTKDGYTRVGLYGPSGPKRFLVHRLVMMTFHPIDNYNSLEVNHIYGEKADSHDVNLEWTTPTENVRHAFSTGLNNNIRESHANAKLTNDQVKIICYHLSIGTPVNEICHLLGDTKCADLYREVTAILNHKAWNSISKDYVFKDYKNMRNEFTDNQVAQICKYLESGMGYLEILERLGYDTSVMDSYEKSNYCDIISNIRCKRYYKHISENYDFNTNKKRYDQIFTDNEIRLICSLLEQGYKPKDILKELGLDSINKDEYERYRHFISRLKTRKIFVEISKNYKF